MSLTWLSGFSPAIDAATLDVVGNVQQLKPWLRDMVLGSMDQRGYVVWGGEGTEIIQLRSKPLLFGELSMGSLVRAWMETLGASILVNVLDAQYVYGIDMHVTITTRTEIARLFASVGQSDAIFDPLVPVFGVLPETKPPPGYKPPPLPPPKPTTPPVQTSAAAPVEPMTLFLVLGALGLAGIALAAAFPAGRV